MYQLQGCIDEGKLNDRLSQLPIDILLSIMSSFTMEEAATISCVSRLWKKRMCGIFPRLNFRDSSTMRRILNRAYTTPNDRSEFVTRVNKVVEQHHGPILDEFLVTFELDISCESHINKWVLFALQKGVKRLELDFDRASAAWCAGFPDDNYYSLTLDSLMPQGLPHNSTHTLTILRLRHINLCSEVVECLLRSCTALECLSIQQSYILRSIKVVGSPVQLKILEVSLCCNLKEIDISAPKLMTFIYWGDPLRLRFRNAFALTEVSVCGISYIPSMTYALKSLSEYLSQLEYLSLRIYLPVESCLGMRTPALTNLKNLELIVHRDEETTLEGWFSLIEDSPALENLTLKVYPTYLEPPCYEPITIKRVKQPFKCLKTLKVTEFVGSYVDTVLVKYIIQNAVALEEVIVHIGYLVEIEKIGALFARLNKLISLSPSLAKFTFTGPVKNPSFWGVSNFPKGFSSH